MPAALQSCRASSYGAALPDVPPVLPCDARTVADWHDFSQTLNPLGTPDSFVAAMHVISMNGAHSTTEDQARSELPALLAKRYGVRPENIAVGSTATDAIESAAAAMPPTEVAVALPTRESHLRSIERAGHVVVGISNPDGYVTPDLATAHADGRVFKAALLSNPGFPTSRLLPLPALRSYLEKCDWVIVDERGVDLTLGGESVIPLIARYPNLIAVETFTDVYSLPGLPLSCAVGAPDVIERIAQAIAGPPSALLANALARLSVESAGQIEQTRELLESEIPWMQCMLSLVPGISIYPAEANFVMCSYQPGSNMTLGAADQAELVEKLQARGFLVRTLDQTPGIEPNTRFCVSVRKRAENEQFISAIRSIVSR